MRRWSCGSWGVAFLVVVLLLIALVLVLPQVDLPDTAFHGDSSPASVRARGILIPVLLAGVTLQFSFQLSARERLVGWPLSTLSIPNFLPILHQSIRC